MVPTAGSIVMASGTRPTGNFGWGLWQLVVMVALQVAAFTTATRSAVVVCRKGTYSVRVAGLRMVRMTWPHEPSEQLAAAHVHDAAADRVAKLKPDGIEASEQGNVPVMGCSNSI